MCNNFRSFSLNLLTVILKFSFCKIVSDLLNAVYYDYDGKAKMTCMCFLQSQKHCHRKDLQSLKNHIYCCKYQSYTTVNPIEHVHVFL